MGISSTRRYAARAAICRNLLTHNVLAKFSVAVWYGIKWGSIPVGTYGLISNSGDSGDMNVGFQARALKLANFQMDLPHFSIHMEDLGRQSDVTFRVDVEVATGERLFSSLMDMICGSAGTVMGWFGVAPRIYFDNNLLVDYGKVPKDYGVYVSGLRRIYELTFETIHRDLEASLARALSPAEDGRTSTPPSGIKLFISYAHGDEEFKDELITMLASPQRRGVIEIWHDRQIEPGGEWYRSIQAAMNDCDVALLLLSPLFLASRFIQEEELPRLLQRRKEHGLRVVPIIVRPCLWKNEPVLSDLQAVPRKNKAVIEFAKDIGARDQVWADIAEAIEALAKQLANN